MSPKIGEYILTQIAHNGPAVLLLISSLEAQIQEFREKVRADNQLGDRDYRYKDKLLSYLDGILSALQGIRDHIKLNGAQSKENTTYWVKEFIMRVRRNIGDYCDPSHVADAVVPTSIILGLAGLGGLLAGPVGTLAGTAVAGLITGQIKPGVAAEKLQKTLSTGDDDS